MKKLLLVGSVIVNSLFFVGAQAAAPAGAMGIKSEAAQAGTVWPATHPGPYCSAPRCRINSKSPKTDRS
jgi:hypothetical protein